MSKYVEQILKPFKTTTAAPPHLYAYKNRFSLIGTTGSGKSSLVASAVLTTQTMSSDFPNYTCRVLEQNSSILSDVARLREGRFPAKTAPYGAYATEAGLLMTRRTLTGEKKIQVPIADVAGEDFAAMIPQSQMSVGNFAYSAAMNLINYVKESDGFILTAPASKAMFRGGTQLEHEDHALDADPDVNLTRILNQIIDYKDRMHKHIKAIFICLTKWDWLRADAERIGFNIYDQSQNGLYQFFDICFPSLSQAVKACNLQHVRYFPTYVEVDREPNGEFKTWPDGSLKIKPKDSTLLRDMRKPSYSEQACVDLVNDLLSFAV